MKTALAACSFLLVISEMVVAQANTEPQLKRADLRRVGCDAVSLGGG